MAEAARRILGLGLMFGLGFLTLSSWRTGWTLSCPITEKWSHSGFDGKEANSVVASEYVIGINPDISGALAVLKGDGMGFSAQVVSLVPDY